jgi:hypothetical protein
MRKFVIGVSTSLICSLLVTFGLVVKSKSDFDILRLNSAGFAAYQPMPYCRVEISDPSLERKSEGFNEVNYLNVDVLSRCSKYQRNVLVQLEIWREGRFFNHRVLELRNDPFSKESHGYSLNFNDMGFRCRTSDGATYFGKVAVRSTIAGKGKETPWITSLSSKYLPCGL